VFGSSELGEVSMKRHNTPSDGATKVAASPGLTLTGANVWQKRERKPSDPNAVTAAPKPTTWCRYADSRLKQFQCR
jgi:hypothetical protein